MSEVSTRIICAIRDFAARRIGAEIAAEMFESACERGEIELADAVDPRGWVPLAAFHAVAESFSPMLGDDFISDAVTWIIPERRQLSSMSLSSVASPRFFYRHLDRARSYYARHVRFDVEVTRGQAIVDLHYRDGVDRRRESCAVARGVLAGVPLLFDMPAAGVVETRCYASGGDTCSYRVTWREPPRFARWGLGLGALSAAVLLGVGLSPWALAAVPAGWALGVVVGGAHHRRYLARVIEEQRQALGDAERDFQRRFAEIIELKSSLAELGKLQSNVVDAGLQALVGELVGELAHEMRNPMSYVLNNLTVLEMAADRPPDEHLAELDAVVADIRHGVEEMRSVLAWFVDGFRSTTAEPRALDLDLEVREAARLLRREWGSRIELHLELGGVLPVMSHGRELVQVLVNLLINASHAIDEGNIWVSTSCTRGRVRLTIRDDGVGMSPDTLARIFERGFTTKPKGSGLGLYISRRIIERNGGSIEIDSEPGGGTTATVELPGVSA